MLNETSAFSKMVQSTGAANAEYLRSLVIGEGGENKSESQENIGRRWLASSHWAAAVQYALAVNLTSSNINLQPWEMGEENNMVKRTKDAVVTLQEVLEGKHDECIESTLNQYHVSGESWWSTLYRVVEGTT